MAYFAIRNDSGDVVSFGMSSTKYQHEITEAEYLALKQEAEALNSYASAVYAEEMTLDDVPEEYQARVEKRVKAMQEADDQDEPADPEVEEALAILRGEVTE